MTAHDDPSVEILVPTPLRRRTGGAPTVAVGAGTVGAALHAADDVHPGFYAALVDEAGGLRRFVQVFVGDKNIRDGEGLATPLRTGERVRVLAAVAGG